VCLPLLALLAPGCRVASPTLEDSLGVVVQWDCSGRDCQVTGSSAAPPDCGGPEVWVVAAGAVALLCGATVTPDHSLMVHEESCRPIMCGSSDDCPQWNDRPYGCDGHVCTTPATNNIQLDVLDVQSSCLLTAPRGATCAEAQMDPVLASAHAMAVAACAPGVCTIPDACRP
jgi:hypothetical protein